MKKYFMLFLIVCSLFLTSCNNIPKKNPVPSTSNTDTVNINVSDPYAFNIEGSNEEEFAQAAAALDWEKILEPIPSDYYEEYPKQHSVPLTATLYKNNEAIVIDVHDPRLVKMLNFYHNTVHHRQTAYTQGSYSPDEFNKEATSPYRLELTYTPNMEGGSLEATYDRVLVVGDSFIGVCSNIPYDAYPFSAFGYIPLGLLKANWLEIFEF